MTGSDHHARATCRRGFIYVPVEIVESLVCVLSGAHHQGVEHQHVADCKPVSLIFFTNYRCVLTLNVNFAGISGYSERRRNENSRKRGGKGIAGCKACIWGSYPLEYHEYS